MESLSIDEATVNRLIDAAFDAQTRAYCPYSKFRVGAALLTSSGKIVSGCNVENVSYGLTICAERCASFKAVSEGDKVFQACAVICDMDDWAAPCGACRQVLAEFGNYPVLLCKPDRSFKVLKTHELLPLCFTPEKLPSPSS